MYGVGTERLASEVTTIINDLVIIIVVTLIKVSFLVNEGHTLGDIDGSTISLLLYSLLLASEACET